MIFSKQADRKLANALRRFTKDVPSILKDEQPKYISSAVDRTVDDVIDILEAVKDLIKYNYEQWRLPEQLKEITHFKRGQRGTPVEHSPVEGFERIRQAQRDADFSDFGAGLF